jgi:hypothetical protein
MPSLAVSRDPAALAELNAETVFMPGEMDAPRLAMVEGWPKSKLPL